MSIIQFYNVICYKIKCTIKDHRIKQKKESLRKEIIRYYKENPCDDKEVKDVIQYLTNHKLDNLLIPQTKGRKKSELSKVMLANDTENKLPYVIHSGKKLYFQQEATDKSVKNHYLSLVEEQSSASPHLYTHKDFDIAENSILYDIGCAEGIFALSNIEKVKHVVLFETNKEWLKALELTFAPWKDKVTIVPKYVSDIDDNEHISIDSFIENYGTSLFPDFIKADVEGAELKVLKGMKKTLQQKGLKTVITTYHYHNDYNLISDFLAQMNFNQEASDGVTLVGLDECKPPYFRKALIRATKM